MAADAGICVGSVPVLLAGLCAMDAATIAVLAHGGKLGSTTAGVLDYRLIGFLLVVAAGWIVGLDALSTTFVRYHGYSGIGPTT